MRVTVKDAGDLKLDDGSKLCVHANQAYDLPDKMAKAMVRGGSAHKGEPKPVEAAPKVAKPPGTTPAEPEADAEGEKEGDGADENKQAAGAPENKSKD